MTDSDPADVDVIGPDIEIAKTPDNQQIVSGGTANFTIYVTNTGDVALDNVTVTDPLAPNCNRSLGTLAAGASTNYTCSRSGVISSFTNVANVTGDPPVGPPVTDSDPAVVTVTGAPALEVIKDLVLPPGGVAQVGDLVVFDITIANIGTTNIITLPLSDVFSNTCLSFVFANPAEDNQLGPNALVWYNLGPLAVGNNKSITLNFTAIAACDPAGNNACVIGAIDEFGSPVPSDCDRATVIIQEPTPTPTNTPTPTPTPTNTPTPTPTNTPTPTPTNTPTPTPTNTPTPTPTRTNTPTPTPTNTPTPTPTRTNTPTPTPTNTPTPTPTPTNTPTSTPTPTNTPTSTPTPTNTPTPTPTTELPNLEMSKRLVSPPDGIVHPGDTLIFQIVITNTGSTTIAILPLADTIQNPRLVYLTASPLPNSVVGNTLIWNDLTGPPPYGFGFDLAPGQVWTVTVSLLATGSSPQCESGWNETNIVGAINQFGQLIPPIGDRVNTCVADDYEPDDSCGQAQPIVVDGAAQHHNFYKQNDEDWASFQVEAGQVYTITTSNLIGVADTQLWLYASDCTTLLAFNDDYMAGSFASQIVYTATYDGILYAKVTEWQGRGECGCYDLFVSKQARRYRVYLPLVLRQPRPPTRTPTPTPTRPPEAMRHPKGIAVNPRTHKVYVASRGNDSLYALNGATLAVIGQVYIGNEPFGVALNPNTNKVYVATFADGELYVIDSESLAVLKHFKVGPEASYVAVNPDTNRIYVTLHGINGVAVINGATDTVIKILGAEAGTFGIAVNRALNRVYVSNRDVNSIITIDGATNKVIDEQTVHLEPERSVPFTLAYNEATGKLYVVYGPENIPNKVWVFRATASGLTPLKSIDVGDGGRDGGGGIVANPNTNHIFVTNSAENTVTVINGATDTVITTVGQPAVGTDPFGITVDTATNIVYEANRTSNNVKAIPDTF